MRIFTHSPNRLLLPLALSLLVTGYAKLSFAEKVCVRAALARGKVVLRSSTVASSQSCPRGTTQLVDTTTLTGPQGPAGANGANGSIRIYGDGSSGTISVVADTTMSNPNLQYENLFVNAGTTLTVTSGTVIRSRGSVTINGTINVATGGSGGRLESGNTGSGITYFAILPASQGHSNRQAGAPEVGVNTALVYGGLGGIALSDPEARSILRLSSQGCGAGSAALNRGAGGSGGGSLTILAGTGIVISSSGSITASGGPASTGTGGGAGGFIVLASSGSITNNGSISANGGSGGASTANVAAGGGGGGGIVHMLAPSITRGTVTADAGSMGSTAVAVSNTARRSGGGAGGGCGGRGADGYNVLASNSQAVDAIATAGLILETATDPVSLF